MKLSKISLSATFLHGQGRVNFARGTFFRVYSLMRDNSEWSYGGNSDMPAEIKGFIIGDMLQLFINDILDQFYFWNPKDYDEAMSSLDYYLNHILEILDTSDITDGDFDF